jgi:hypothetical protein
MDNKFKVGDVVRQPSGQEGEIIKVGGSPWGDKWPYLVRTPVCSSWYTEDELEKADEVINGS